MVVLSLPKTFTKNFHNIDVVSRMPYRFLKNVGGQEDGDYVSIISMGGSAFGGVYEDTDQEHVNNIVEMGLKGGINLIDTAYWYGHGKSEERLGLALKNIPRSSYYLYTKCCRYESNVEEMFDFSYERTLRAVDESLERLGVSYLDCMQIHDPEFAPSVDIIVNETLPALDKARREGKIRSIGLTGYPLSIHKEILERTTVKIDTCLLYCHYSLNDTSLIDSGFLDYLDEKGIGYINASALSMGLLTERGPPVWHPANKTLKLTAQDAAEFSMKQGVNISKLAVDFTLRQCRIPTTLVSTVHKTEMERNLDDAYNVNQLNSVEEDTLKSVRDRFFGSINHSWEGVEVAKYRRRLENALGEFKC